MEHLHEDIKEIKEDISYIKMDLSKHIARSERLEVLIEQTREEHQENLKKLDEHLIPLKDFLSFCKVSVKIGGLIASTTGFTYVILQIIQTWPW